MDSPLVAAFIKSALIPALVVLAIFVITGRLKEPWRSRIQGLSVALAFALGAYTLISRLNFPPHDVLESLMLAALLLAVFVFWNPRALGERYVIRGLFVLALFALVLWPLRNSISSPAYHRNILAFFCLALGVWSIVEKSAGKMRPSTLILLPLIALVGLSLMILFKSSASFSQTVGVMCAILGGLLLLAMIKPAWIGLGGLLPFVSVFVIMLMVAAHFYLDINPWHLIYMCLPFLVMWIREWLGFVPQKTVPEAIILGGLSAAPLTYFVYQMGVSIGPLVQSQFGH